jgi:hypothetical protein
MKAGSHHYHGNWHGYEEPLLRSHTHTKRGTFVTTISFNIFGAWIIWKHSNACVFEGASPSVNMILGELKDEHSLWWCMAGAKKLQGLDLCVCSLGQLGLDRVVCACYVSVSGRCVKASFIFDPCMSEDPYFFSISFKHRTCRNISTFHKRCVLLRLKQDMLS